ncbi:hypothetical protein D6829_01315, partial [Candidatus Pacearchaeota archaeon]
MKLQKEFKLKRLLKKMNIEFVPIDYGYFDFNEKNILRLIGRTKAGKQICVLDEYEPNFYAIIKKGVNVESLKKKIL